MGKYFVVYGLVKWEGAFKDAAGLPFSLSFDKAWGIGYLPVYETREEAEAANPGRNVLEIDEDVEVDSLVSCG